MQDKINVIVIDSEKNSREILLNFLNNIPYVNMRYDYDDIDEALNNINVINSYLIFIDVTQDLEKKLKIIYSLACSYKNIKIVATSYQASTVSVSKVIKAGACNYLMKPFKEQEVIDAVKEVYSSEQEKPDSANGKIISVYSLKGGIGKTSISVNVAHELSQLNSERTLILDMNSFLGDVATFLNFSVGYTLSNFALNPSEEELTSRMQQYKNTFLYILTETPDTTRLVEMSDEKFDKLLNLLKKYFSYIVIDLSNVMNDRTKYLLKQSDIVILPMFLDFSSIRNTQICLTSLIEEGIDSKKIKIIINRYLENSEIKIADVQKMFNKEIYFKIPNNYYNMIVAINKGEPLSIALPDTTISETFKNLAVKITDDIIYSALYKN